MRKQWSRREFGKGALAVGAVAGGSSLRVASLLAQGQVKRSTEHDTNLYPLVDPALLPALKGWPQLVLNQETLAVVRQIPLLPPQPAPMPQPVERHIPGAKGAPEVHVTIVDPDPGAKNKPALVHMHGGGYVAANTALYPFIQNTAHGCGCVVVSVDYRMAPGTKYPGSLDDNYAALRWVYDNAAALGVDRARIAVGGESAGGGHAAALAMRARDRAKVPVIAQILLYPMLDDRTGSSRPEPPSIGKFIWNAQCNRFGWTSLLGVSAGSAQVPAGAVPARLENLAGLPPAWVGVGSIDLFVDEDVEYARRLIDAGVSTELHVYPGGYHAFDLVVPNASISKRFTESWMSALRRAFATA